MKIFPSPGEPVLAASKMVFTTLSTSESSTTVDRFDLAENSEVYFPVPRPDSSTGFSPLPLPFPSIIVHPLSPISFSFSFKSHILSTCTIASIPVSYTHLRAHETPEHLVCRLL